MSAIVSSVTGKFGVNIDSFLPVMDSTIMETRAVQQHIRSVIEQLTRLLDNLSAKSETPEMQVAREKSEKGDDVIYRGDHQKCYKRVWRVIHAKEITEEQAIRRGWMLPAEQGGRKISDPTDPIAKFMAEKVVTPRPRKKRQ